MLHAYVFVPLSRRTGVALFKKFDEKRADLTEGLTYSSILEFVNTKSVALLTEFTQEVND